jgi:hypothetical protein
MTWEFRNNGQVFRTINATGFVTVAILKPVNFSITTANLPLGTITVTIRMRTSRVVFGMTAYSAFVGSFTTNCGLAQPSPINGNTLIFPGESKVYSVAADPKASSYTWEVPAHWAVNGIMGPKVSGQGNSVIISVSGCSNSALRLEPFYTASPYVADIKVSAASSTCGTSTIRSLSVNVDIPFNVITSEVSSESVSFSVDSRFVLINWRIPTEWNLVDRELFGTNITINHNGLAGVIEVSVVSNQSGCYYTKYINYQPPQPPSDCLRCPQLFNVYPNPVSKTLTITSQSKQLNYIAIETNGAFESFQKDQVGEKSVVDVSHLEPGYHILKIVDESGKRHLIRFLKKD